MDINYDILIRRQAMSLKELNKMHSSW